MNRAIEAIIERRARAEAARQKRAAENETRLEREDREIQK